MQRQNERILTAFLDLLGQVRIGYRRARGADQIDDWTIRRTRTAKAIIDALGAGANEVINVEFYLSDLRKYRDQARELATKAAQEKAQDLAAAAGAFAQTKAISSAFEGISRNPGAAPHIRFLLIFGLVLIETLVIYALLITIIILMVQWGKYV